MSSPIRKDLPEQGGASQGSARRGSACHGLAGQRKGLPATSTVAGSHIYPIAGKADDMKITITLNGTKPMLQHNARLSNPLDPYTRALRAETGKQKRTDEDLAKIMHIEARGSVWETSDGLVGVKSEAVWRSIQEAATKFKLGAHVKRGLLVDDVTEPLTIDGKTWTVDEFLTVPEHVDYRSVVIQRRRLMRARAKVPTGWTSTHTMELLEDEIDLRNLTPVFERAGRLVGIGNWRPRYGTFTMEVTA